MPSFACPRAPTEARRSVLAARTTSRSAGRQLGSDAKRAVDWNHRGAAGVDGVDDLGVVDALQVDGRDTEVGVSELALDDDQRHALARHLDGVGVAQLMGREASSYAGVAG